VPVSLAWVDQRAMIGVAGHTLVRDGAWLA
jgi:hypothetical protein